MEGFKQFVAFIGNDQGTGPSTNTYPFNNIPAGKTHTFVPEIFKVIIVGAAGGDSAHLYRGEKYEYGGSNFTATPNTICFLQYPFPSSGTTGITYQFDFQDGAGNGLLIPENSITLAGQGTSISAQILYKMKKVPNKDLFIYLADQGSSQD